MTPAQRQRRRRALRGFNTGLTYSEDPRREKPVAITWVSSLMGRITVDGEYWAAVEWSNKHQCWCIEDCEGRCLAHQDAIRGAAESKDAAVALAEAMIRDRRMPTPQEARRLRWAKLPEPVRERREAREADDERRRLARQKRAQQPAAQRRRAEAQQRRVAEHRAWSADWDARRREAAEQPLYEMLAETFDFTDPELWKSNSFAALRPRLIIYLEAQVARLESDRISAENRQTARWRVWSQRQLAAITPRLAKAREILELLQPECPAS